MLTPGVQKVASSEAIARSQAETSWQPAALAIPCTLAMMGLGRSMLSSWPRSPAGEHRFLLARQCHLRRRGAAFRRSCPALKAGPAALITITLELVSRYLTQWLLRARQSCRWREDYGAG